MYNLAYPNQMVGIIGLYFKRYRKSKCDSGVCFLLGICMSAKTGINSNVVRFVGFDGVTIMLRHTALLRY